MSIRRRETKAGVRYDVQWRLPDRSKRNKTFSSERAAKQFEAKLVTSSATGESLDPRGGRTELETVYRSWIASRADLSAKVRRGYEDNWRLRIQPRFGNWPIAKINHESIQRWLGGQGRDRTGDLPLFRRTLIPTELPGRKAPCA